jgi:hypothetical protein
MNVGDDLMKNYPTHVPCRHYGDGWYCDASCSSPAPGNPHDYNPDAGLERACSRFWVCRKAKGRFFGHIDGRHVEAHVFEYDGDRAIIAATKKFTYKKYPGKYEAYRAAARWIERQVNGHLFHKNKNQEVNYGSQTAENQK